MNLLAQSPRVFLVGAGPGNPDWLTVKAHRLLQEADVVLHDALVSDAILSLISPKSIVIDIGKRRGHKLLTQDEINALLVHYGSQVKTTVRLKGGDATVFGRAGEEIQALRESGISYEIVPGITSAIGAAAGAGISLTDRRLASSVVFTTGHRGEEHRGLEWDKLVTSGATVVIYMPGTDYARVSRELVQAGLDPVTPCVIVSCAGRPEQQVCWTNVDHFSRQRALPAPSILIVGECAAPLPQILTAFSRAINETTENTQQVI
jgi:uroporphyrin-III C-methyltransferase